MISKRGKVKQDGLWYRFVRRITWGKIYCSLNNGVSFHPSMREAYDAAYRAGNLDLCPPPVGKA